jgi:cell division protein FtsL
MGEKLMPIEVHFEKRIINNNVIREADAKSHREYMVVTVIAAIFLLGVLFIYGWQHYRWMQYSYRIEEAKKKREQLSEIHERLRLERETLSNPQRIETFARRDLGMVSPAPGQLVIFHADAPLTIPTPQPSQPVPPQQAQLPQLPPQPAAFAAKR